MAGCNCYSDVFFNEGDAGHCVTLPAARSYSNAENERKLNYQAYALASSRLARLRAAVSA